MRLTKCFRYQLLPSADLLKAFQALDTDSKGYLTIEEAKKYFTQHGEAFAQVYASGIVINVKLLSCAITCIKGYMCVL